MIHSSYSTRRTYVCRMACEPFLGHSIPLHTHTFHTKFSKSPKVLRLKYVAQCLRRMSVYYRNKYKINTRASEWVSEADRQTTYE